MYLRVTERHNRDGSAVRYFALAENIWNADAKRSETRVVHSFGRADQVDHAALQRLVRSINRILGEGDGEAPSKDLTSVGPVDIDIDAVFELGIPLVAR
ncbi:MAG: IS1634 family transposase, partial [Rhizomicrobium sp.]